MAPYPATTLSQHRPEIVNPIHLGDVWAPSADWQGMHQDEAFPEKSALSTLLKRLLRRIPATKS